MADRPGQLPVCTSCPYKRRADLLQTGTLLFALGMWGVDNVISWLSRFLPGVETYNSAWWMNIVVVGMLAAAQLWKPPRWKTNGDKS